jgi:S-DNA-T family DNA segregation ATPase FtsK/SpoIIIE
MSIFKEYDEDKLAALNSEFLISSWSFSKVAEFSRNQKSFEMSAIYGYRSKNSATTVAGQAYHEALERYFKELKDEYKKLDLVDLENIAFEHIDDVPANKWKLQKTTPTIAECKVKAAQTVTSLLANFLQEVNVYLEDVKEILDVEFYSSEFLTINGVDIPLLCNFKIDLVVQLNNGKTVIIDHKSKGAFSSENELKLSIGRQAITYVKGYESATGLNIDEVWFVENKYSKNRDKSSQLICFKIELNEDTRRLYEALLYEPLKCMIEAVNDPDFVYMINDSDNFVDSAELYDFWCKTQIAEVDDFDIPESKKELVAKRLKKIRDASIGNINPKIIKQFQKDAAQFIQYDLSNKNMTPEEKIEHVLRSFGAIVRVAHVFDGYSSNTYLLEISAGVKISSIHSHKLDLANALNVANVRISKDLVVHEGKSYLAIEFAKKREKDLLFDKKELIDQKLPLGKDNFGNTIVWDLNNHSTPHALICGATGSGKSVEIKNIIEYGLLAKVTEIIIFDPKYEFDYLNSNKKIRVYNDIIDIEEQMAVLVSEMNERVVMKYSNTTLVIFDEFADAVANSRKGNDLNQYEMVTTGFNAQGRPKQKREIVGKLKSLEENLKVLLQKGRSSGYRVVAATQRASTKVITGDSKTNFPVQICFRVPKEIDSRVVLDEAGAESLAGYGDGLIRSPEYPELVRFQAFYKP